MGRRRSEIFRTIRGNLFILGLLTASALLVVRCQRIATELSPHAEKLDYIAETIRTADFDAASTLPVFELRKRFRAKITECVKITTRSRPVYLKELPGRLDFHVNAERRPFLSVDFNSLKSVGPTGSFYLSALHGVEDNRFSKAIVVVGLLGVYSPKQACPAPS